MKTKLSVCILTMAVLASSRAYACCESPVASLSVSPAVFNIHNGYCVCVGQSVTFDATGSYDPDCSDCSECGGVAMLKGIRQFQWDFNGDGVYDYTESPGDGVATHTYSSPGTYWVKLKVYDDDDDCCCSGPDCGDKTDTTEIQVTAVKVDIEAFDRVPPWKTKDVQITVEPIGIAVYLDVVRTYGTSGSASVSPSAISCTTTVTVYGGEQTSVGCANNLSLRARLDGNCVCDSEAFTVCAHPINFQATNQDEVTGDYYGLIGYYAWDSDSGIDAHLNKCKMSESLYNYYEDRPPFYIGSLPAA